jgi:hypothetical protein
VRAEDEAGEHPQQSAENGRGGMIQTSEAWPLPTTFDARLDKFRCRQRWR